jgi:hypothetical protein
MIINNLTTEDIKFLKELKYELNTQSSRMTANPRMYQVRHEKFEADVNEEGNYFQVEYEGEVLGIFEWTQEGVEELKSILRENTDDDIETLEEIGNISLENLENRNIRLRCVNGDFKHIYSNAFLTEKACREHIECNRHHYRNPVDYLNYAFRNPEMEKLLRILSKIEIKEES